MGRNDKPGSGLNAWGRMSGIVFEMLAIIGAGTWGGHKLDTRAGRETPVFTIILSLLSVGIALYAVIRQVNQINKDEEEK